MRGPNSIFFFLAVAFFVIGTHQAIVYTIAHAYGFFMLSLGLLFLFSYRNRKRADEKTPLKNDKSKKRNR